MIWISINLKSAFKFLILALFSFQRWGLREGRDESRKEVMRFLRLLLFLTDFLIKTQDLMVPFYFPPIKAVVSVAAVLLHAFKQFSSGNKVRNLSNYLANCFYCLLYNSSLGMPILCSTTGLNLFSIASQVIIFHLSKNH